VDGLVVVKDGVHDSGATHAFDDQNSRGTLSDKPVRPGGVGCEAPLRGRDRITVRDHTRVRRAIHVDTAEMKEECKEYGGTGVGHPRYPIRRDA
jgi:hypothetical protein